MLQNKKQKDVAVVIPIYNSELTEYEKISLAQSTTILSDFDIFYIGPEKINIQLNKKRFISFNDFYFESITGYNELLLSDFFYNFFLDYKYILIVQLDTFIFKNDLLKWCQKGFDYIGAPWMFEVNQFKYLKKYLPFSHRFKILQSFRKYTKREYLVGNGGLSLRNVNSFLFFLEYYNIKTNNFKKKKKKLFEKGIQTALNEDAFWALYVPKINKQFKVAEFKDALSFSFETDPQLCYLLNNNELPFGCHAWEKFDLPFWKKIIESYGYKL